MERELKYVENLSSGHETGASLGAKRQDKFSLSRVGVEVSATVVRLSNLPYKEENFPR